jgi:hypothetical protein
MNLNKLKFKWIEINWNLNELKQIEILMNWNKLKFKWIEMNWYRTWHCQNDSIYRFI